ncbi:MAG TPA: apolipoprotein N-acyltransferase [Spirochaetia bacterium]|nr:apolipoprotein N-acyltransferase [Spirochaetia bacterium]
MTDDTLSVEPGGPDPRNHARRIVSYAALSVVVLEFFNFLFGPFGMSRTKTISDYLFLALLALYAVWAIRLRVRAEKHHLGAIFRTPETLFVVSLILFLLSYLFASTANLTYAQRFAMTHGNLRLAPDSTIQRLNSASRYLPLLGINAWVFAYFRLRVKDLLFRALSNADPVRAWGLPLSLFSAVMYALAFPSAVSLAGFSPLAFVCLVPLILAIGRSTPGRAVFYGVSFGIIQTMLANFWLGTFSLVSLQFITVIFAAEYSIFMVLLVWLMHRLPRLDWIVVPVAWVAFDYLRSRGFLGYSWGMLGSSQYGLRPLIQIAAVTGIWGVTFLVTLVNSAIAHTMNAWSRLGPKTVVPLASALLLTGAVLTQGLFAIARQEGRPVLRNVRVSLVQENTDPRKNDYQATFDVLKRLTQEVLPKKPDLVVWSETAFVPNIRRWSQMDPKQYPLARIVDEFLAYQKQIHTWLVTGNDDYTLSRDSSGNEVRSDYNASVLFSPQGRRVQTYHKIHLVPFTEYFPYKKELPSLYRMLQNFDVYLWEPGTEYTVFHTPEIAFATPICFEDSFPDDVRQFVLGGAQVIINLSNDYWSLSKIEGKQHYINSLFRAVENRRPLMRATASGLTAFVDLTGKLVKSVPYYTEATLTADVPIRADELSPYTRWGDWFPEAMLAIVALMLGASFLPKRARSLDRSTNLRRDA